MVLAGTAGLHILGRFFIWHGWLVGTGAGQLPDEAKVAFDRLRLRPISASPRSPAWARIRQPDQTKGINRQIVALHPGCSELRTPPLKNQAFLKLTVKRRSRRQELTRNQLARKANHTKRSIQAGYYPDRGKP
jgi:hypothetical protein